MCMYSVIAEDWSKTFKPYVGVTGYPETVLTKYISEITRGEFESLRKEVESLKKVLIAAKIYDEETGQKDCEKPELIELLRKVAEAVGVKIEDALPAKT